MCQEAFGYDAPRPAKEGFASLLQTAKYIGSSLLSLFMQAGCVNLKEGCGLVSSSTAKLRRMNCGLIPSRTKNGAGISWPFEA